MGRRIATWALLMCCSLAASVSALTADDYVAAGRAALFERTQAGLLAACDVFSAALEDTDCPDCRSDRELVFLNAVARTAQLFVDRSDVLATEDFFALAEVLGIPLDGVVFWSGETEGSREGKEPRPISIENVLEKPSEMVLPQLAAIIATLDAIEDQPDPFVVYLVPEETHLAGDLEVDYGDVLILKGLLLAYRGLLATRIAHESVLEETGSVMPGDGADWRQETLLGYIDVPRLLSAPAEADDDTGLLAQARADWIDALTCTVAAAQHMVQEDCPAGSDPQEDEFVYVDQEAQPRLDAYRQMLATLRDSLVDGAADAPPAATVRIYDLYTTDSARAGTLTLVFDLSCTEGRAGRMVLADGTALEIDWFGSLDEGRIGVSMFSGPRNLEGWLEVTLDGDLGLIRNGTLDLWGARSVMMAGLTGQVAEAGTQTTTSEIASVTGSFDEMSPSDSGTDWANPWPQAAGLLVPISPLWLAFGHTETLLAAD